jgi:hypothetical protein
MAAGTAPTSSAGAHRADSQSLTELNERSAGLGTWDVGIFHPYINEYKYISKQTRKETKGASFNCILVSLTDPSQYVAVQVTMRSGKMEPLTKLQTKFKENLAFRISKVALDKEAKQEFLHTPVKLRIDLSKTKADPLLQQKQDDILQPIPSMSIKECSKLQQSQRFDVTAFVEAVSEPRKVTDTRQAISVQLIDDSGDAGKAGQLTFAYFFDLPRGQADDAMIDILRSLPASAVKEPYTFFALQGKQADKGYAFEADSKKEFFFVKAAGAKANGLVAIAESLHATPQEMRHVLMQASHSKRDYAEEPGSHVLCKLLSDLSTSSQIQPLNENTTVWQTNWTEVAWPTGDTLVKKDGSELWFQTSLRDLSGQVERVWMGEKAALSLSQLADKNAFLEANNEGKQLFPIMSSVKVIRDLREVQPSENTGDVSQLASTKSVNLVIVQAEDQPLHEAPTKATLELIPMLRDLKDDTSAIMPAGLHMVESSPHYAFTVTCTSPADGSKVVIPCQKILALVRSSKSSKPSPLGAGFKLITPGVDDLMSKEYPTGAAAEQQHTLSVICTLENMPTYRLDPPRGGSQHALVVITGKTVDAWVVESVQLLSPDEAAKASESFKNLLHLAMHIHARDRKRAITWTDQCSPALARKCSRLGRSPTDNNMPDPWQQLQQ